MADPADLQFEPGQFFSRKDLENFYQKKIKPVVLDETSKQILATFAPGVPDSYTTRIFLHIREPPAKYFIYGVLADSLSFPLIADGVPFRNVALYISRKKSGHFYLRFLRRKSIEQPNCLDLTEIYTDNGIANLNRVAQVFKIERESTSDGGVVWRIIIEKETFAEVTWLNPDRNSLETFYRKIVEILDQRPPLCTDSLLVSNSHEIPLQLIKCQAGS